jgi:redox-sensitive bicupin YhaK (pirin superfamily)
MGPVDFAPGLPRTVDVRPHPHIGLSTVTYLLAGEITHRDSVGVEQAIRPGEVNWMTAGRGITHSERFERARREGGPMHGLQAWVALPERDEEIEPSFAHHGGRRAAGVRGARRLGALIAGRAFGETAPARTHSPLFYLHWELQEGARAQLPADGGERAAYLVSGRVEVDGTPLQPGQMAVLAPAGAGVVRALAPSVVMALGGEPLASASSTGTSSPRRRSASSRQRPTGARAA